MMKVPLAWVKKLEEVGSDDEPASGCGPGGGCSQGGCSQGGCNQGGCNQGSCGPDGCGKPGGGQGGCKPGGCSQGDCSNATETLSALDSAFVSAALDIPSVKVTSMDSEHAECAGALRRLAEEGSHPALEAALSCLAGHFEHEEALFEQYGFGVHKNELLSAKKTHAEDHQRILNKIRRQLSACAGPVPAEFVREVFQDFHEHTSRYDSQYAEPLSEQGAR